jgi:hypothetical protein
LEYVLESAQRRLVGLGSDVSQHLAGTWLQKMGQELGEAACHVVQFSAATAAGPVLAEVDRNVPWLAEAAQLPIPQHTPVPSAADASGTRWDWQVIRELGWRYSGEAWADLFEQMRATGRKARGLSPEATMHGHELLQ